MLETPKTLGIIILCVKILKVVTKDNQQETKKILICILIGPSKATSESQNIGKI